MGSDAVIYSSCTLAILLIYVGASIRFLEPHERGVIFRLGRARPKPKGPGLVMVFSPVDRLVRMDLRAMTKVIKAREDTTGDNVPFRVDDVLYFRVVHPTRPVFEVGLLLSYLPGCQDDHMRAAEITHRDALVTCRSGDEACEKWSWQSTQECENRVGQEQR